MIDENIIAYFYTSNILLKSNFETLGVFVVTPIISYILIF